MILVAKVALDSNLYRAQPVAGHARVRQSFWTRSVIGLASLAGETLLLLAFMVAVMSLLLSDLHRQALLTSGLGSIVGGCVLLAVSESMKGKPLDRARLLGTLPVAAALLASPAIKALLWG